MPKFESFAEKRAEEKELQEKFEHIYEKLPERISKEAERLRAEGFLVDNQLRINPQEFKDFLPPEVIDNDTKEVEKLDKIFSEKIANDQDVKEKSVRGEVLEMTKCLLLNKQLYKGKLTAVRTSKYDDYKNGVDQLVFNSETAEPVAVVDTTTDWKTKADLLKKKIKNGCWVKYGLAKNGDDIKPKTYQNLPLLIISIHPEKLAELSESITDQTRNENFDLFSKELISSLAMQAELAAKMSSVKTSASYNKAGELFNRLKNS